MFLTVDVLEVDVLVVDVLELDVLGARRQILLYQLVVEVFVCFGLSVNKIAISRMYFISLY
jgi:hypothetical protein